MLMRRALQLQMGQHVDMISISPLLGLHFAFWHCCCVACEDLFNWIVFESCFYNDVTVTS